MFMLFGGGSRNWRLLRFGVFALVMGAGLALHYRGTGYALARGVYLAVVLSFLVSAFWRNKSRRGSIGNQGTGPFPGQSQYGGDGVPPSYGSQYPPSHGSQYPPSFPYVESPASSSPADNPPSVAVGAEPPAVPVALPATASSPVVASSSVAATPAVAAAPTVAPAVAPSAAPAVMAQAGGLVPADGTVAPKALNVAPTGHTSLSGPGQEPGWYPDPFDPMARHYWDGSVWTQRVKWDGKAWLPA